MVGRPGFGRPSGTCINPRHFPALKRWAKFGRPSGAAWGAGPSLFLISTPEGAPSLCLRSLQTQGGDFDFVSPEIWPGPAMKLVGPLAGRSPGLRLAVLLALALEIEGHGSADEILQGRLIDLVGLVDVDGAPDIAVEAGVE